MPFSLTRQKKYKSSPNLLGPLSPFTSTRKRPKPFAISASETPLSVEQRVLLNENDIPSAVLTP